MPSNPNPYELPIESGILDKHHKFDHSFWKKTFTNFLLLIVVIASGIFLLAAFAFATMVPPNLSGWDWYSKVLGKTFGLPFPGLATYTALIFFISSSYFLARKIFSFLMRLRRRETKKPSTNDR
jgi:hypothetical protein